MQVDKIISFLPIYYVYILEFNFFLLIVSFLCNFKYIKNIFLEVGRKYSILLIFISTIGAFAPSFTSSRVHRIYYDEDIYNNIGQCIAEHKRAVMCNEGYYEDNKLKVVGEEYNKQPSGYPYLISVIFRIFGTNERFVFILNNIILGLTIIVLFLISYLLFNNIYASFIACLSYMLIPINLQWFNSCAVEPPTAFFSGLAILASLIYLKNKEPVNFFFLISSLAFSLNFRTESILMVIVIGFILLLKDISVFKKIYVYIYGALLFLLSTGIILHLYAMRGQDWGATGAKVALDYFSNNFKFNSLFYFNNIEFPLLFTIFSIAGLFLYKNKMYFKEKIIVLIWFLAFYGVFLFFYAGSYKFGQDVRFSILSYAPISVFLGLGVSFITDHLEKKIKSIRMVILVLIMFNFAWFMPFIRSESEESWAARADHKYAMELIKLLPEYSLVYTHNPNMFLLNKKSAIQTSSETYNPGIILEHLNRFNGNVFVHYNYWSNVDYSELQRGFTENILVKYDYVIIKEYYYKNYKFGLYKILGLKKSN